MSAKLPYLPSPGSLKKALEKVRSAATPERVTNDFVSTVLQIKGGTGAAIPPYLKRIGFVGSDGAPTDLYKRFRNPSLGGVAVAEAVKHGYKDLSQANEYFYKLSDKELQALIVQVTGLPSDNRVVELTLSTLRTLKSFATFDMDASGVEVQQKAKQADIESGASPSSRNGDSRSAIPGKFGFNLAYTINLNLPATADQAVFNAIFKSLKEHLLSSDE